MRAVHVACGQFVADLGRPQKNLEAMIAQTAEAQKRGSDLILFPEMCLTGYLAPEELMPLAEQIRGDSVQKMRATAARLSVAIVFGFPEQDPETGSYHNSFVFIDADGDISFVYRKIHLWNSEAAWATPGQRVPVHEHNGTRFSGWICYDTRFPELARIAFLKGAEVCLVPTAWLGPMAEWDLALRSRALDNGM